MLAPVIYGPEPQVAALRSGRGQEMVDSNRVRIEIDAEQLACLMRSGPLHASEIRCLDCSSKKCVQKIMLKNLLHAGITEERLEGVVN